MTRRRKLWCKTVLLAVYGNLAARARSLEMGYLRAEGGVPRHYPTGPYVLDAHAHVGELETEMSTVNVIHRGMIEAEQRTTVLRMARELTNQKHKVIAIYADAIMVKSDRALPLLPAPWRVDAHLTRLKFANATTFTSREMTKVPGIAREDAERFTRIARFRR